MDVRYHTAATVEFDEEDLQELRSLLRVVETSAGDLDGGIRGLDLGGGAERIYHQLKDLVNGEYR
jgi:hypothetical protein